MSYFEKIPQVLASFLESSLRWYFQLKCSSKKALTIQHTYITLLICFLPIFTAESETHADIALVAFSSTTKDYIL